MKKLLRKVRRAIRRVKPDIVAVYCPTCDQMVDAFEKHQCMVIEVVMISYES